MEEEFADLIGVDRRRVDVRRGPSKLGPYKVVSVRAALLCLDGGVEVEVGDHIIEDGFGFVALGLGVLDCFAQGVEFGFLLIEFAGVALEKGFFFGAAFQSLHVFAEAGLIGGPARAPAGAPLPLHWADERRLPRLPERSHKPLACGGPDAVWNLQWQTVAAARARDRWELRACAR